MHQIYIETMLGLGDTIYQRGFVANAAQKFDEVYLYTAWPEIFDDIPNIKFVKPVTRLRTQKANIEAQPKERWSEIPFGVRTPFPLRYGPDTLKRGSILKSYRDQSPWMGRDPLVFSLPKKDLMEKLKGVKYALVRPVTERAEWNSIERSPSHQYVSRAIDMLRTAGYKIVTICSVNDSDEYFIGPEPYSDFPFHDGKLTVNEILGIIQHAKLLVGGVSWIVPAGLASKVPTFVIHGGKGAHNAPEIIGTADHVYHATPLNYCMCGNPPKREHTCDKYIDNFEQKFSKFLEKHNGNDLGSG